MRQQLHFIYSLRWALGMLACCALLMALAACDSSEEPTSAIGYYVMVQPKYPIYSTGGMKPLPKEHLIGEITRKMKMGIDEVYPVRDQRGDDVAVIMLCDSLYRCYYETYRGSNRVGANSLTGSSLSAECVVCLYRARMSGYVVRGSVKLRTYRF